VLKVSEVYEKQIKTYEERPDGSEYAVFGKALATRDVLINTDYLVAIHPFELTSMASVQLAEGSFPEGTKFSTVVLDGNSFRKSEMVVVGSFEKFCQVLQGTDI